MSRSALWRQEGAKKRREKEADDLFSMAVEEGRVRTVLHCKGVGNFFKCSIFTGTIPRNHVAFI